MSGLHGWPEPPTVPMCQACGGSGLVVIRLPELAWRAMRLFGTVSSCKACSGSGRGRRGALPAGGDGGV